MGAQAYMRRVIKSGKTYEVMMFPVAPQTKPRKGRVRGATIARKQDANERACTKRFARMINCNFRSGDLLLSPNYDVESMERVMRGVDLNDQNAVRRCAEHDLDLFLRRLKRELSKQGVELRYLAVTSDMDGDTGEIVRAHHHVLIGAESVRMEGGILYVGKKRLADIWGRGSVDYRPLRDQADYTPVAEYLMRQVRRLPDARKYRGSRNLKKPVLVKEEIVYQSRELKVPRGCRLMHRAEYLPGEAQYIRYVKENTKPRKGSGRDGSSAAKRGRGAAGAV